MCHVFVSLGFVENFDQICIFCSNSPFFLLFSQAGVAAIALGVYEKYGVTVPIVPVGLNYFRGALQVLIFFVLFVYNCAVCSI